MARLATADRFLITVSSMPGPWDTLSGQEVTRDVSTMREQAGGPKVPRASRQEYSNITLTRMWDQDRDGDLYRKIAKGNTYEGTSVTMQELDADGNVIPGAKTVYSGCLVVSAQAPDADANSGDASKLTVVFSVSAVA